VALVITSVERTRNSARKPTVDSSSTARCRRIRTAADSARHLHGMNGIAEGMRQLRGTAVDQIAEASTVLVTAGTGVSSSGSILVG